MSADPHAFRGAHPTDGGVVIRAVRPGGQAVTVFVDGKEVGELEPADTDGLFEGVIKGAKLPLDYELEVDYGDGGTFRIERPLPLHCRRSASIDLHLAGEGRHEEIYARLGAHVIEHEGVRGHGVRGLGAGRAVGLGGRRPQRLGRPAAPDALARLERDLGAVPARGRRGHELQVRDHRAGRRPLRTKADPYAFAGRACRRRPPRSSTSPSTSGATRSGSSGATRARRSSEPMSIYEVHLGSWRLNPLEGNRSLTYLELADELAAYAKDMGFTHLELLPVMAPPVHAARGATR